jgi:hypothetical protein
MFSSYTITLLEIKVIQLRAYSMFIFDSTILKSYNTIMANFQQILAFPPMNYDHEKYVVVTPLDFIIL